MKHIKCEAIPIPWGYHVVRIVEQTHRGMEFGTTNESFGNLISLSAPAYYLSDEMLRVYVRGSVQIIDSIPFLIPDEKMPMFREEIRAYNQYFADKPNPEPVKAGQDVEVIE